MKYLSILLFLSVVGCGAFVGLPAHIDIEETEESRDGSADAGVESSEGDADAASDKQDGDACTKLEHSAGISMKYLSCEPIGTYNQAAAMLACATFIYGYAASCVLDPPQACRKDGTIVGSVGMPYGYQALWDFGSAGTAKGHAVIVNADAGTLCPTAADSSWN